VERIGGAAMTKNDVFAQRMLGFALDRGWKPSQGDLAPFMEGLVIRYERARDAGNEDTRRLDDLHNRLMQAPEEVSESLGLPDGWTDLRKAIDETDGRP
jgi:hypothetical protein